MFSSNSDDWATPQWLFDKYNEKFNFTCDACASHHNAKCTHYYTREDDGLKKQWEGVVWLNPPYGRQIGLWMEKAYKSSVMGATVVCLVPARTDPKWWCNWAIKGKVEFVEGRLKFNDGDGNATFPSAIITYHAKLPHYGIFHDYDIAHEINLWGIDRVPTMAPWLLPHLDTYEDQIATNSLNSGENGNNKQIYKL